MTGNYWEWSLRDVSDVNYEVNCSNIAGHMQDRKYIARMKSCMDVYACVSDHVALSHTALLDGESDSQS